MSLNLNSVTLAGHLTRDPEVKFLANERAVASFGIAINRRWKTADGETKEEATFLDCEAWGRTAELVGQYLTKGSPCYIEGRLKMDVWDDKKTGEKRSKLKVVAESVQFLSSRKDAENGQGEPADAAPAAQSRASATARKAESAANAPATVAGDFDEPPF